VADKITVESRRAGLPASEGVRWISGGTGDFEVEQITRAQRGTSIILHLRDDARSSQRLEAQASSPSTPTTSACPS
jgi:HSP90 family molecular chaperone